MNVSKNEQELEREETKISWGSDEVGQTEVGVKMCWGKNQAEH